MSSIKTLKGYDEYGFEIMNIDCGPTASEFEALNEQLNKFGISAYEAAEAIREISNIISRLDCAESRISYTENQIEEKFTTIQNRIDSIRPELDALAENLKQKVDLEIFKQKVSEEENMFLRGINYG